MTPFMFSIAMFTRQSSVFVSFVNILKRFLFRVVVSCIEQTNVVVTTSREQLT